MYDIVLVQIFTEPACKDIMETLSKIEIIPPVRDQFKSPIERGLPQQSTNILSYAPRETGKAQAQSWSERAMKHSNSRTALNHFKR